jgi:cell division septal protein FtsQ
MWLAVAALGIWLCVDRRFHIRDVHVDGAHTIDPGEILALARVDKGRNVFIYTLLEHGDIDKRIETGEPAVEAACVRIKLPGTLVLRITERTPYAQVRINRGPLLIVDANDVPYRIMTQRDPGIPAIITPATTSVPELGKKLDMRLNNPLGAAFSVLDQVTHSSYFDPLKLREIRVHADLYTSLIMSDRPVIRLGLPVDLPQKLQTAAAAIDSDPVRAQAADYVDVTLPSKPAIKMKDTVSKPI